MKTPIDPEFIATIEKLRRQFRAATKFVEILRETSLKNERFHQDTAMWLELIAREATNALIKIAHKRPDALKPWARKRLDWPAFTPEHKASRDANKKMIKLIELGKDNDLKTKHVDLGQAHQELVTNMILSIEYSRVTYNEDVKKAGKEKLAQWRHKAQKLPPAISDDPKAYFDCGWEALEEDCESRGVEMSEDPAIQKIGLQYARSRAIGRRKQKLITLEKLIDSEKKMKAERGFVVDLEKLEDEKAALKEKGPEIWPSQIVQATKDLLSKAFIGRVER